MTRQQDLEKKGIHAMLRKAKTDQDTAASSKKKKEQQQKDKQLRAAKKTKLEEQRATGGKGAEADDDFDTIDDLSIPEPPFQFETHVKRGKIYFRIQLHKIPHQYIDIKETDDTELVIDTTRYSKKWRLQFPFPGGMLVDSAKGEYEFDGALLCVTFDIKKMPKEEADRVRKIIEEEKSTRKMRFARGVDKDTGLEQRLKTRMLSLNEQRQIKRVEKTEKKEEEKQTLKEQRRVAGGFAKPGAAVGGKKAAADDADDSEVENFLGDDDAAAMLSDMQKQQSQKAAGAAGGAKKKQQQGSKKTFVADGAAATAIANSVSDRVREQLDKKKTMQRVSEAVQRQRSVQSVKNGAKKRDALHQSFMDIVKQKQQSVKEHAEAAARAILPAKKRINSGKSVSFAASD